MYRQMDRWPTQLSSVSAGAREGVAPHRADVHHPISVNSDQHRRASQSTRWPADRHFFGKEPSMAKLTTQARKKIPASKFALPGGRYPVEDKAHARDAKARASQQANAGNLS